MVFTCKLKSIRISCHMYWTQAEHEVLQVFRRVIVYLCIFIWKKSHDPNVSWHPSGWIISIPNMECYMFKILALIYIKRGCFISPWNSFKAGIEFFSLCWGETFSNSCSSRSFRSQLFNSSPDIQQDYCDLWVMGIYGDLHWEYWFL